MSEAYEQKLEAALADAIAAAEQVYEDLLQAGRTSVFDEVMDNHRDVIERAVRNASGRRLCWEGDAASPKKAT